MTVTIRAKLHSERLRADVEGDLHSILPDLLCYVEDPKVREQIIEKMKELHERQLKFEAISKQHHQWDLEKAERQARYLAEKGAL